MIINVKKVLFFGLKNQIDLFFSRSQIASLIEFISLKKKKVEKMPSYLKEYVSALRILKQHEMSKETAKEESKHDIAEVVKTINRFAHELEQMAEKKRLLEAEYARILPYGDFSEEDLHFIQSQTHRVMQFFCIKSSKAEKVDIPQELIYVGTEYDLDYYFSLNKQAKKYPNMIEIVIEKPIGVLQEQMNSLAVEMKNKDHQLKLLTKYQKQIEHRFIEELNKFHLTEAISDAFYPLETEPVFMVEGWIADNHMDELDEMISDLAIEYQIIGEDQKDRKPTYMENQGIARVGEDLVNIYDTPSTRDKDPSLWVYFSFMLFFAMIISDAGYGLLYLGFFFLLKWLCRKNTSLFVKRFNSLVLSLSLATIIWGALSGSFFGMSIDPDSPFSQIAVLNRFAEAKASYHLKLKDDVYHYWLQKFPKLKEAKNGSQFIQYASQVVGGQREYEALDRFKDNIMMELSLLVGALHIALSFLRYVTRHYAGIGWILFIIGGYLAVPFVLEATSMINFVGLMSVKNAYIWGMRILYFGLAWAVIVSFIQYRLRGLDEILKALNVFGDILSYLRIYALGLAGMVMASTFNELGGSMPLFFGIFVIFIGHTINFFIGIMGGVIHGLRLNFIEWYHYSFEGDGKLFNPLRLLK